MERLMTLHAEMKILFISGFTRNALTPGARRPADAFLAKPFSAHALRARVREVLTSQSSISS